jgi:hypothetical protein
MPLRHTAALLLRQLDDGAAACLVHLADLAFEASHLRAQHGGRRGGGRAR